MPISKSDFESAGDVVGFVLDFLRVNRELAFTAKELLEESISAGANLGEEGIRAILIDLERRKRVQSRTVRGLVYYAYQSSIGFRPHRE